MKACGIIAEYNPFHEGHIHHIQKTREQSKADVLIAVMSGNFVQRGEPAVIDKWQRAKAAVQNGIDLIIELPYLLSVQSAAQFAHGGVSLLKRAEISDISFGSECGNLENLLDIAETPINPDHLKQALKSGLSYPKAYRLLTHEMFPNDILAVSYLKEIRDTDIRPILVPRTNDYNSEVLGDIPTASALRKAIAGHIPLPDQTPMKQALENGAPVFLSQYYPYLRTFLQIIRPKQLQSFFLISEGIENHLTRIARDAPTYELFMKKAVTPRYTASRIRRCILQILNQVSKAEAAELKEPETLRILAFNDTGRSYLRQLKEHGVPVANRFAELPEKQRDLEYRTTCMYASVLSEADRTALLKKEIGGPIYLKSE